MSDLKDIMEFLVTLNLDKLNRVPTLAEHRKAFRDLLSQHPDKTGKDSNKDTTKDFQAITEAARIVLDFIIGNPQLQTINKKRETQEQKETFNFFEKSMKVVYNQKSVTFSVEPGTVDA